MAGPRVTDTDRRLTAIEVAGFKSAIEPVRVNFRDITILAGANSTGKSAIMQPLLLIKQTMEKQFDPGGLAIDGPLTKFTHADQFFSYVKSKAANPTFYVTMIQGSSWVRIRYGRSNEGGLEVNKMTFNEKGEELSWVNNQILKTAEGTFSNAFGALSHSRRNFENSFQGLEVRVSRDRAILAATPIESGKPLGWLTIASPATTAVNQIRDMIYLPGLRGNPERNYFISSAGPQYPGSFNDYVASIIHRWESTKDDRLKSLGDNLNLLGLTKRVTTEAIDDTRVEVHVGRLPVAARGGTRDTVNIADVGFGVSQILPVLVALLAATENQIVFVEQPELHLHPRAQVALADIIIQSAQQGVRLVIETHSSLLILALQAAIAEERITSDRLSLNWFTRDAIGQTHVTEAQIREDGSYGDWPEDFGTIELDLQDRYMTLVERRHARG
jgi:predicted ATPase